MKQFNFNKFKYYIEYRQDDIYDSISKGYLNLAKECITKFMGIIAYTWQCDVISDKEYTEYRDWAFTTQNTIENLQTELQKEGYKTSL